MKMTKLLALVMALLFAFACVGSAEQTAEDAVLATAYDGALKVSYSDVKAEFDAMVEAYVAYYTQYGYSVDMYDTEMQNMVAQQVVQMQLTQLVAQHHAQEAGYELTAERDEEIKANVNMALADVREYYETYMAHYGIEGEALQSAVDEQMNAAGYTFDVLYENEKINDMGQYLFNLAVEGVEATEDEARAAFAAKLSAQKEAFADLDAFADAYVTGSQELLYVPENVRKMQCIFVAPGETEAAETAQTDPAMLTGRAKADAVLAKIRGGEDFMAVMAAYSEDGATAEQMETGYPVAQESKNYSPEFKDAAMALENAGDVSDVIETAQGYFILRYAGDLEAFEADFDSRRDAEMKETLANKQNDAYAAYVDAMIEKSGIVLNDMTPLFNIFVAETIEAAVAYGKVSAETDLTDMPAGDAVAKLSAGASLDILGRIGVDGEEYIFAAVPGTAFKGYVNATAVANMEPDEALAVDNGALVSACAIEAKLPTFTIAMNDGSLIYGELYPDVTPETVGNFVSLANSGFYNGLTFHRVIAGFMIQGGDPNGIGTGGPGYAIRGEFSENGVTNDLSHTRGVLSMARSSAMDSAGSQFFIMHADGTYLDGQYAGFGAVLGGIETVDLIASEPTDGNDKPMTEQKMREVYVETYGQTYEFTKLDD